MKKCDACGTTILFGGVSDGGLRFCNATCHAKGSLIRVAAQIPPDVVRQQTGVIYRGQCPNCQGPGPVDVHTSYRVWSALVITSWQSRPRISCRSCGRRRQLGDAAFSLLLGWWGIPWGFIMTPVQIWRNVARAFNSQGEHEPSKDLERATGMAIAADMIRRQTASRATQPN